MRPALLLTLLATTLAAAQAPQKRPMTFADLQAMHRISDPQVSPSGKWVLFSVTDVDLDKNKKTNNLWIVPLAGGKEVQLTKTTAGASNGRFSPDGKWVSFTHKDQIWLAPFNDATGTLGDDHPITSLSTGADGVLWAPDSRHFLFTSSVYPDCESHAIGIKRFDEEAQCNADKDAAAGKSFVKAQVIDHLLYRHWNSYVGPTHSHIFYAGLDANGAPSGTPRDLTPASVVGDHEAPTFSLGGPLGYAISPDGKEIAYEVNLDKVPAESTNNDIFTLQLGAAPSTAKKVSTSPGSDDGPQYSPDGKYLAWRSQARAGFESDKFRLMVMDRSDGKSRNVMPDFDGWVDEFSWSPNSSTVYFTSASTGEVPILDTEIVGKYAGHVAGAALIGEFSDLRLSPDGKTIVATRMTAQQPAYITRLNTSTQEDGPGFALSQMNDAIVSELDTVRMERFSFAGANGTEVEGFLIRPPNFDPAKKYPLKFLIHGGPQGNWGDAWSYRWNPELFAANGYVVVMINPRGSTGYGQQFVDEVSGDWGGRPYFDLMKGLDYVENKYPFIDKHRECALGASYGGFMADYILTHTDRFACIVTHDGMYNPQSAFGTTEELWFNEWEFRPLVAEKGAPSSPTDSSSAKVGSQDVGPHATVDQTHPAHPWDFYDLPPDRDPFRKFSPMLAIANAKTPTLVIHSQLDYRLDLSEGLQLYDALQIRGVPSKFLYFPDEGHWVMKPQNSQLWYQTVNEWVDQWTHTNAYEKK